MRHLLFIISSHATHPPTWTLFVDGYIDRVITHYFGQSRFTVLV